MIKYSNMFNKQYDDNETVRIVNTKQAGKYIFSGLKPVDIFYSQETLVFVFNRAETKSAYEKWCNHEL